MKSIQKLLIYIKPYFNFLFGGLGLLVIATLMELVVPRLLQFIIDEGITPGEMSIIWQGVIYMLIAAVVGAIAAAGQAVFVARMSQHMTFDLRNDLYTRIQTFSFSNLDKLQTGSLMTRLSSDMDMVRMFTSMGLPLMVRTLLLIFGSLIFLVLTNAKLSLIMLILIPAAIGIFIFFARTARPMFQLMQKKLDAMNNVVQENLSGVRVVKAFVRERFEISRFEKRNVEYMDQHLRAGRLFASAFPSLMLLTNLGTLAVIWLGGMQVIGDTMTVGELVAFNNYLMTTMFPILMLGMVIMMLSRAEASAERIVEALETDPNLPDPDAPKSSGPLQGAVSFDAVSFHYNGSASEQVLANVSFSAQPGQRIAVLGATGSGKSTLVNLIPRFYDVNVGRVLIDGVDVRDIPKQMLRGQIGMVLQQTTLFSGTVQENIAYGKPDASLEDVIAAAKAAQAHEFIVQMPDGYNSDVESRGANLSGGQKQRIAIARALLIQPSILILDDSTSAVDMETEYKLQQALDKLMETCTTFIIAQRISSVLHADQIIVLERGEIVATGRHHELLETSEIYQDIYRSQFRKDRLEEAVSTEQEGQQVSK